MWFIAHQQGPRSFLEQLPWTQRVSENTDAQHTDLHANKAVKVKDAFPRLYSNLYFNKGKILDCPIHTDQAGSAHPGFMHESQGDGAKTQKQAKSKWLFHKNFGKIVEALKPLHFRM